VLTGSLAILLFSTSFISDRLVRPLERRYSPLLVPACANADPVVSQVRYIVVLVSGYSPNPRLPATGQLGDTLPRVIEGIRVFKKLPACKLIMSGGGPDGVPPAAQVMAEAAESLGIDRKSLLLESKSRDTETEAQLIRPVVGNDPFILVTEASHMPRAMALFKKQGMRPIAAPANYLAGEPDGIDVRDFLPNGDGFQGARRAIYEYLALIWERLRGKV
jgi:uncharacterized SAM-binding protein YcdF (DUF218 family)